MGIRNGLQAMPMASFNTALFDGVNWFAFQYPGPSFESPVPCSLIHMLNRSNTNVTIRYGNAAFDCDRLHAGYDFSLNLQINALPTNGGTSALSKGTNVWLFAAAPGVGLIYLSGYYQNKGGF